MNMAHYDVNCGTIWRSLEKSTGQARARAATALEQETLDGFPGPVQAHTAMRTYTAVRTYTAGLVIS